MKKNKKIVVLGIGNVLLSDEGFGIRIIEVMKSRYIFDDNVSLVDGGVLGINLFGVIFDADILIVIDIIKNKGKPGDIYKIKGKRIPDRIRAKNSLHQIDFIEVFSLCKAFGKMPKTLVIGIEPEDVFTLKSDLSNTLLSRIEDVVLRVLKELSCFGVKYKAVKKNKKN